MKIKCLLLVEDEPLEVARTTDQLAMTHLDVGEVLVATSLAQAIRVIAANDIDIILLDLDLVDSKSIETLSAVRAVTDAVVIVLSTNDDECLGVAALRAGADDFLIKANMNENCLRRAIVKSMTRRNIRRTAARIYGKFTKLSEMAGVP